MHNPHRQFVVTQCIYGINENFICFSSILKGIPDLDNTFCEQFEPASYSLIDTKYNLFENIIKSKKLNFSVPTGNFGDIYAGYLAKKMGLPIDKLIVATNQNDILHRAISKGDYTSKKVSETFSPSMDIQIASNFERLIFETQGYNSDKTKDIMVKVKENNYKL